MAECPIRDAQLHRLLLPAGEIILAVPLSPRRALPLRSGPHHATAFKRETSAIIYTDSTLGVVHISRLRDAAPGGRMRPLSPLLTPMPRTTSVQVGAGDTWGNPVEC